MPSYRKWRNIALIAVLALFVVQSIATELRGRIDGIHPYARSPFPLSGARLELYVMTPQGLVLIRYVYTGGDGMYYLSGINPGMYTLQVNGVLKFPLIVNPQPYQDIQPILLR